VIIIVFSINPSHSFFNLLKDGPLVSYMEKSVTFYNKPFFRWFLRIGITLLFVIMVNRGVTLGQMKELGGSLQPGWLSAALCLAVLSLIFQILRWQAIVRVLGFAGTLRESVTTFVWGNLLGFLTPGRVGELGRGLGLDPARKADSVAAVVVDKGFATAVTVLFGMAGMVIQTAVLGIRPPGYLVIFMAGFLVSLPVALLFIKMVFHRSDFFGAQGPFFRVLRNIAAVRYRIFNWRTIGFSVVAHILLLLQTVMILRMLGCGPFGTNFMIAAEAYAFMLFLPFFIANIGLREYSFGMMFSNLGPVFSSGLARSSIILGVSTLVLIMNVIMPAMAGLCAMAVDKKHKATI
jgi:hypothetical protein